MVTTNEKKNRSLFGLVSVWFGNLFSVKTSTYTSIGTGRKSRKSVLSKPTLFSNLFLSRRVCVCLYSFYSLMRLMRSSTLFDFL